MAVKGLRQAMENVRIHALPALPMHRAIMLPSMTSRLLSSLLSSQTSILCRRSSSLASSFASPTQLYSTSSARKPPSSLLSSQSSFSSKRFFSIHANAGCLCWLTANSPRKLSATSSQHGNLPQRILRHRTNDRAGIGQRMLALSVEKKSEEDQAREFLAMLKYEPRISQGIIATVKSSGANLMETIRSLAGRWEVGEDGGLVALAKAVEVEMATKEGKKLVKFFVKVPHASFEFECEGLEGMTLREIAQHGEGEGAQLLGEYIECACSGVMACSTCHVIVDPAWIDRVGYPEVAEQDMLDLAYEPCDTSRLGCQVVCDDVEGKRRKM
eukprot:753411-Hanusia_phi.AAC.3